MLLCVRFSFFVPSQEIGVAKRLRNDLFCVEWDVKPQLNQSINNMCTELQAAEQNLVVGESDTQSNCISYVP